MVHLQLAQARSPYVFKYYFTRHLRVVVVEVLPVVGSVSNCLPEGTSNNAPFGCGRVERKASNRQVREVGGEEGESK